MTEYTKAKNNLFKVEEQNPFEKERNHRSFRDDWKSAKDQADYLNKNSINKNLNIEQNLKFKKN
ncbi:MAG: hypothetical protein PV340_02960 [Wolbachia sp.]|nr:hypothetical protein [Wolbachia sp.]MDD9336031.1 hypothetical protein [Wolbachia sp.]